MVSERIGKRSGCHHNKGVTRGYGCLQRNSRRPDLAPLDRNLEPESATCWVKTTGERFGLAVGEFAVLGKPGITFSESKERAHLEMLGNQALPYRNTGELAEILREFRSHKTQGTKYEIFVDPKVVMELFRKKFLDN